MELLPRHFEKKYNLMLCELHKPEIHGKTYDSDTNIETYWLVYDRYKPISGLSYRHSVNYEDNDSLVEHDTEQDMVDYELGDLNNDIKFLKEKYLKYANFGATTFGNHPTIRNYYNIILNPNYIKAEIGEYIILPTDEAIAILKTFWIRIIQKKWKKVFKERKNIISQRCHVSNLSIREMTGRWNQSCFKFPGLRGMLSELKK